MPIFTVAVPPLDGEKYYTAEFHLWIPDGAGEPLRGIIMKQHGCRDDGSTHIYDLQFRSFAARWNMALMSSHLTCNLASPSAKCTDWCHPGHGTGRAFFQALRHFSNGSGRPEIAKLPIAFYGHSGGGGWSASMNALYPERTLAYIHIKGVSIGESGPLSSRAAANPGLLIIGEHDEEARKRVIEDYFAVHRRQGALLAKVIARNTEHEVGHARYIALSFLEEVFRRRLPLKLDGTGLQDLTQGESWLGEHESLRIAPQSSYIGDHATASWLPSRAFAEQWRRFAECDQAALPLGGLTVTPPSPPTQLRVIGSPCEDRTIAWDADVSWQAGLKRFHVYRDGCHIASVEGQSMLYGDYPASSGCRIAFEFTDTGAAPGTTHNYELTQVDHADQESARSEKLWSRGE